ncbi:MAG TPA: metal ABC transporter ATP-binding protein [Bellilinea sp.]|nr:metal ABC transporter ATP-binding protein [Bellilinea sp.]
MAFLDRFRNPNLTFLAHPHPHSPDKPILKVEGLTVEYDSGAALDNLDFLLQRGERLAVVGPNGAGKSTLFKVIAGVLRPSRGLVEVAGHEPGGHICIAYVPQRTQVDWNFPATVADVVMMGRAGKLGLLRWPTSRDWILVRKALATVRLSELADRQIQQLSGGQQQRMFIARALAQEAELILMDEPLTGLDTRAQEELFGVMELLHEQGVTVMVALHDLKIAGERFDRVMLLNRHLVGIGSAETVLDPAHLMDAYGGHLRLLPGTDGTLALGDSCCDEGEHDHA